MKRRYFVATIMLVTCVLLVAATCDEEVDCIAAFTAEPTFGVSPLEVAFDGSISVVAEGATPCYHWSFGDAAAASGTRVEHTYVEPGVYGVILVLTDSEGGTSTTSCEITVRRPAVSELAAIFSATPT